MGFVNQNGFSLIEVIIAGAIMAGLALGYAQITANTSGQLQRMQNSLSTKELSGEISALLSDPISCTESLKGLNPKSATGITKLVRVFRSGDKKDQYVVGQMFGQPAVKLVAMRLSDAKDEVEVELAEAAGTTFLEVDFEVSNMGDDQIQTRRTKVSVSLNDDDKIRACATASSGLAPISVGSGSGASDSGAGAVVLGYGKQSFNGVPEDGTVKGMYCTLIKFSPWADGRVSAIATLNYDVKLAAHDVGLWGVHVSGIDATKGEADLCIDSRLFNPKLGPNDLYWSGGLATERVFWIVYGM